MNETIAKLRKQIEDLNGRQKAALEAADADGVKAEDRAKHLAEFDRLQADKARAQDSLKRTEQLLKDHEEAARTPATTPVVQAPHNPHAATAGTPPARFPRRAAGRLLAFHGADAADRAYRSGMWAAATLYGSRTAFDWCQGQGLIQEPAAFMGETQNERGGYFVPDVLSTAILELTQQYGVFRRLAQLVPMGSETFSEPRLTGGMSTQWVGEGEKPADSEPTWDLVKLVAKRLATKTKMSRELNEDSIIDLGDRIARYAAIAFAYAEDRAGFVGDGTLVNGGIVGLFTKLALAENAASVVVAPAGRDTVGELTLADYLAVVALYPEYAGADPRWITTKGVWATSMSALALATGGVTPADIAGGGEKRFLGYPVEVVNALPRTYAAGSIPVAFGDLKLSSMFGDRRRQAMVRGMENDDFSRELFTLLATERVDIVNHTITDPKDSTLPGPVVGLQLAAA